MVGLSNANQPDPVQVRSDLGDLIVTLSDNCLAAGCTATDTQSIVKGACTAVMASGAMTLH